MGSCFDNTSNYNDLLLSVKFKSDAKKLFKKLNEKDPATEIEIYNDPLEKIKKSSFRDKTGDLFQLDSFYDKESISGKILLNIKKEKKVEHQGIKVEVIGLIEFEKDKKNPSKFIALTRDLEPPGTKNF
jgi:hypothetical protein